MAQLKPKPISPRALRAAAAYFERSDRHVWAPRQIERVLRHERPAWGIPPSISPRELLAFLERDEELQKLTLRSNGGYPAITRFARADASPYEIALSLRPSAYLTHGTAVFLHALTDRVPKTIYVNVEQSPKRAPASAPTQHTIDRAFSRQQRTSSYIFLHGGVEYVLLSGKCTRHLGVMTIPGSRAEPLAVTGLERTLVDIAVRPAYAGGVEQVLAAYEGAKERVDVDQIANTLAQLAYAYPYHQAIGYYLERAGVAPARTEPLRRLPMSLDFHLAHGMGETTFVERWRLRVPSWMEPGG